MAISKVIYKSSSSAQGVTWMDATSATAAASDIIAPKTAMLADGVMTEGTGSGGTTPTIESLSVTPSTSQQTFNAAGVDGYKPVVVAAMPSGTAGTPTASKGTVSNHAVTVTPSVTNTTGYITGGTKTGTGVTVTAAELESGSKSITANGTDIDVSGYSTVDVAVPSSSKNVQVDNTNHRIASTSYTDTEATLTVSTAGTYDIYWSAFRSSTSSGTNGTQWYKNDVAQGSAYTSWSNSYCQSIKVSNVSLAKNDIIKIYARSSSNSRYVCVSNLTIIQTA